MIYELSSIADETAVRFAYLYLFGRPPESQGEIESALSTPRTIAQLRRDVLACGEYETYLNSVTKEKLVHSYLACKAEQIEENSYITSESSADIILLQTSDPIRYIGLLQVSSKFNERYAESKGIKYSQFIGVKRGKHPHHAMYNRVHILSELIDSNFTGWVLYVDADAIVSKPTFDVHTYLANLRARKKVMALHIVHQPGHEKYSWWNVNDGCFAVDLSSSRARLAIKSWSGIYKDIYSLKDYERADQWASRIIDDQTSLWFVLQQLDMQECVELTDIQGSYGFTKQILRKYHNAMSSEDELVKRCEALNALGNSVYLT